MSIVMVGPFPGPFDRTHYSDSSGEHPTGRQQPCPPMARAPALRQPGPYLGVLQEQEPAGTPGTPHDGVAYSAVMQTDAGAPPPAYIPTCQEPQPETPPEPPGPYRAAPSAKSKCYALLRRLAAVALVLALAAVVAGAVSRDVRGGGGGVRSDTAPLKAGNAAVKSANATGRKSAACPCSESSTTHATPATVRGAGGHGTPTAPGAARHHRHRGGTSHGRKAGGRSSPLSSSPSSSSSSTSSSPGATTEAPWQATEEAEREVPREPALRDVGDLTPSWQRTVPTTSEPTRTSEGAAVAAATSTSQAAAREASSLTGVPAGEATGGDDRGRQSGLDSAPTASPGAAVSLASSAAEATAEVGSVPVAKTTASTDLPEVINEADARTDVEEV
ncbi:pneumococcal serine-rich repeat protein-like [Dermacentor albipictus]|uniref:pneumococcal serine-rich repeat protein-like n=1 Tax=Dermacentor albipictus TaxID=60249 RepID=UPI0038FCFF9D